ncbi:MAG: hypothetical protein AVDCRST_MAG64-3996, partial [uncultured Phycisphaerae bacterium]
CRFVGPITANDVAVAASDRRSPARSPGRSASRPPSVSAG